MIDNALDAHPIVIAAKLDIAVSCFQQNSQLEESLLPHLPPEMAQAMAPIADGAETVKQVYWPRPAELRKDGRSPDDPERIPRGI